LQDGVHRAVAAKPEESAVADKEDDKKANAEGEEKKTGEGGEEAAEEGKKKGGKKKIIIIAAAAGFLVLAAGGGGAAWFFMHGSAKAPDEATAAQAAAQEGKPVFYPLGDLLVNLAGEGKHPNFLKVKVVLQLADEKDIPLMDAIKPRIIDNFQVYLRELRIEDLRGSAGMYRLREELLLRVTEAAQPVRVRDVLFQEMLVQ
jgi:flagellar FliL protein